MKLYMIPGLCSLAPHIVACEMGMKLSLEKVDFATKKYSGGDFHKINPTGLVPALQLDSGEILTEASAISLYLAGQKPDAKLLPKEGSLERARTHQWLNFIATEIHKAFTPVFLGERMVKNPEGLQQLKDYFKELLSSRFNLVEDHLKSNNYMAGTAFTVADPYLYTMFRWTTLVGMSTKSWPNIQKFMGRLEDRQGVKQAMSAEDLKPWQPA